MPPPTAVDPWLASRRFGVIIDAGSSGSRLQIYSWKDPYTVRHEQGEAVKNSLPKVEKGTRVGEDWVTKVEPGISSFGDKPEDVAAYLAPLLSHARSQIPPSLQPQTPLFLLATAGMRLLPPTQQAKVLQATCDFLKFHSNFRIDDPSQAGPCGSSVRIITGEEEGLFGWIAVNYLMDGFTASNEDRTTYGFLDMGGASTQIAFEPSKEERERAQHLIDVRLRLLGGQEIHHQVFVTTWLGYGTNQARERYVGQIIDEHEAARAMLHSSTSTPADAVAEPCLPKNLKMAESSIHTSSVSSNQPPHTHTLVGTGSFEQCLKRTSSLLNKDAPCPDTHCLFNGVYVPPIDFSASHFIGVSEYWYSSEHVFGLGGAYDVVQYERAASEFCSQDWDRIVKQHEESRKQGRLGGDGEVEEDGRIVGTGKWGDQVELSRLRMQCFKAAWIVNVLHEGIGMPRIVDPGGNGTTKGDDIAKQAENKGLGRPTFQSLDTVGDIAISWTLGKMVLEASKEVPPLLEASRPITDPLDDIPDTVDSPVRPIRPPFIDFDAIEDHISPHLPSSLTRHSLGFSLISFLFYALMFTVFVTVAFRLRHLIRGTVRRCIRRKERDYTAEGYSMEEGHAINGGFLSPSRLSSPPPRHLLKIPEWVRRLTSAAGRYIRPASVVHTTNGTAALSNSPSLRRSVSYFTPKSQNGSSISEYTNGAASSFAPSSPRLQDGSLIFNGSVSSLTSRSRNSSRLDLSTLIPRQPLSRTNSGLPAL